MLRLLLASCVLILLAPAHAAEVLRDGVLPNGLRYLLKESANPPGKVALQLVVKTGALDEADDERGVAHLLEHMAFRRTRHFGKGEVAAFLDSQGMRFGSDSNAWTGYDETVYHLKVGRDALPRALRLVADWGGGIEFDAEELATERRVVLDEMRMRSKDSGNWVHYIDTFYPGREYSARLPIGVAEIVAGMPLARVADFYRRHYVASRMTLIVVGDIDAAAVEALLPALFGDLPAGAPARRAPAEPLRGVDLYASYHGAQLSRSQAGWVWLEERRQPADDALLQRDFLRGLALDLVQRRLHAAREGRSYDNSQAFSGSGVPDLVLWGLNVDLRAGQPLLALEEVLAEAERAARNGFSAEEVGEVLRLHRANAEARARLPLDQQDWLALLSAHAREGGRLETPADYLPRLTRQAAAATPQAVQQALAGLLASPGVVAQLQRASADDAVRFGYFNRDDALAIRARVAARQLEGGVRQVTSRPLLETLPPAGPVLRREAVAGGAIWHFANGLQLLWQKRLQADEQVGIAVRADGGMLALPESLRVAGSVLAGYQNQAGLGGLTREQLADALAGRTLGLSPWIGVDEHGLGGSAAPQDLEPLLQVLHLALQPLPADERARQRAADGLAQWLRGERGDRLGLLAHGEAWPWRNWPETVAQQLTVAELQQAHALLFGDPAQLRVTLTGIADPQALQVLAERYLGSLKARPAAPRAGVALLPLRPERVLNGVGKGQAQLSWRFVTPQAVAARDAWLLDALADILRQRLMPVLRVEGGLSYAVHAGYDVGPGVGVAFQLANQGAADRCLDLAKLSIREIRRLQDGGVTAAEVDAVLARMAKQIAERPLHAAGFAGTLSFHWRYGPDTGWLAPDLAQIITPATVQEAALRWLAADAAYLDATGCSAPVAAGQLAGLWQEGG
ncbi:M16 family metallopeptidase [Chitinilyticum litopenaei]|uniref:M16 family metallopeptidase n=1 Tax=Chitinilyticum litopenaei TaxID=1121276 RepID=UPI00040826E3|nr:insulinase family protein [Chitinilyticum litopenaei]